MDIRNIAIIAHVDHGKTTLVDELLKQSGSFRDNQSVGERMMDSNALERERGITILAKVTSLYWQDTLINVVDTPGHADFGGEVERILNMVDGVILLVDAAEGPMPQTKFVLGKALKTGLRPVVALNKVDKHDARADEVLNEVFDLFSDLGADEHQLDFPVLYGSGKQGWMAEDIAGPKENVAPLLDLVLKHVPSPTTQDGPFRMLATTVESDAFLGRILTGRILSGSITPGTSIKALDRHGKQVEQGRISKVLAFRGLERQPIEKGEAGDIVALAGLTKANVSDTLCDPSIDTPLAAQPVDPPTLSMTFRINDGPLSGQEGKKVQSRVIRERLFQEAEGNIALQVEDGEDMDSYIVSGRGELQLGILIETMRREGFELTIGKPQVVMKKDEHGQLLEPIEEVVIDLDEEFSGPVVQKLSERKADLVEMTTSATGRTRLVFHAPTRGLIGYQSELLSDTRGTAIFNRLFHAYAPYKGEITRRHSGVLISNGQGEAVAYALWNLEERGAIMVEPGEKVYEGMIVGEHTRGNDLVVNALKGKQLTNIRAAGKDEAVRLSPPLKLSLEKALAYINDDELVEVTPQSIRLRKALLDPHERKKAERAKTA
jgi:GTP-binding protein